ncbi:hypothetical protein [Microcoleus sp. S13_C5]
MSRSSPSPPTAMTHIATQEVLDGKPMDWLEKVSDEQYQDRFKTE